MITLMKIMRNGIHKFIILFIFYFFYTSILYAEPIEGYGAKLQILDKITSQIETVELNTHSDFNHSTLTIEFYTCYKRPPEEIPEDFVLISVLDEIKDNKFEQVFKGWMISSSPSVTPFEHPIYDLWIKDCKIDTDSK